MDKSMIDAVSGGALMDKTPAATRHLISNMVGNTQQFGIRGPSQSRMVNEIGAASNLRLENQLSELTSLVRPLVVGQHQPNIAAKVCVLTLLGTGRVALGRDRAEMISAETIRLGLG
ncbi:hypothetical protein CR513_43600, partial [Mucuna pruriens]